MGKKLNNKLNRRLLDLHCIMFHMQIVDELKRFCLDKAKKEKLEHKWDDLKQLRLEGILHICEHASSEDLTLSIIAWLAYQNGADIDFALLPKDKSNIWFTDIGMENVNV